MRTSPDPLLDDRREHLLQLRYGPGHRPRNIVWNEAVEALLSHRSVRRFAATPLPPGTIETLIAAAQSASNSSNLHHWSVIAVGEPALKAALAASTRTSGPGNESIEQAPLLLLWVPDLSRNHAIATAEGDAAIVHEHLDALVMATIDASLAAQNAAIAAESIGLGVCFIGAMRNDARAVAELVGLPRHSYVAFGMVIGYPDPATAHGIRPRPAQSVVLHRERYDAATSARALEGYEEILQAFRTEQGMKPKRWTDAVKQSAVDMRYMDGREHLRSMVQDAGFTLR